MADESRLIRIPKPIIEPKPFCGIVNPGMLGSRGALNGNGYAHVRRPEKGETTPTPAMRVEAARQWCVKKNTTQSLQVAEVLVEQWHRLQAIKAVVEQKLPDGDHKDMLRKLCDGQLVVVKM